MTTSPTCWQPARYWGLRIATAESCTGGMVAAALTDVAGSSDVFDRGFVTYSNAAKIEMLGVRAETLAAHGAVSEAVAREMAEGALAQSAAELAVSITGIAGPGGSEFKPEGRVCFGLAQAGSRPWWKRWSSAPRAAPRCARRRAIMRWRCWQVRFARAMVREVTHPTRKAAWPAPRTRAPRGCIASLNTRPMMPGRMALRNSKSTRRITSQPPSGTVAKGPDRFQVLERAVKIFGQDPPLRRATASTRLPKRSRNTLKLITRSASITSPPSIGPARADAGGGGPGQEFGIARDIGHKVEHLRPPYRAGAWFRDGGACAYLLRDLRFGIG